MNYTLIEKSAMKIVGVSKKIDLKKDYETDINRHWFEFLNNKGLGSYLESLTEDKNGVIGVCKNFEGDIIDYLLGVICKKEIVVDNDAYDLSQLQMPSSFWAIFEIREPLPRGLQNAMDYVYDNWFLNGGKGYEHDRCADIEYYYKDTSPVRSELWIPLKVKE